MYELTLVHWSGITIKIKGELSTMGMGRKGPAKVQDNLDDVCEMIGEGQFNASLDKIDADISRSTS